MINKNWEYYKRKKKDNNNNNYWIIDNNFEFYNKFINNEFKSDENHKNDLKNNL